MYEQVSITKLVHGGQGLGRLDDGRAVFVWNALPGELVDVRITKNRKDYAEGIADKIIKKSKLREVPKDESYMSTSPWQILDINSEDNFKKEIIKETFEREKVITPQIDFHSTVVEWNYRNKMEYSFWADDSGLSLALFNRGTHSKVMLNGSSIARPEIDYVANELVKILSKGGIRGSQLKSCILRCNKTGEVVAALFVKDDNFPDLNISIKGLKGLEVCYSNPKSPASVKTKVLYSYGDIELTDKLLGKDIAYNVYSFFQVNLSIFSKVLVDIKSEVKDSSIIDFYSGVGTIGVSIGNTKVFVDVDEANYKYALKNADKSAEVVLTSSEKALDYVNEKDVLIVDPPRAGLHKDLVETINQIKPPKIIYLSCNPITQARDIKLLEENYQLKSVKGFNFFPKTPHIEALAVMILK